MQPRKSYQKKDKINDSYLWRFQFVLGEKASYMDSITSTIGVWSTEANHIKGGWIDHAYLK